MNRFFITIILSGVVIGLFILKQSSPLSAQKVCCIEVKENRIIIGHTEIFGVLQRPRVLFDHGLHEKAMKNEGCNSCHHADTDGNLVFEHIFSFMPDGKNAVKEAYHSKCISCHTERFRAGKSFGAITCGECHDKKRALREPSLPVFVFDYYYHDKHVTKLENKCDLCHHSYDKNDKELIYEEGTEQSCYYCHDLNAKRGPFLVSEIEVTKNKNLTMKKVSHNLCVNCHLRSSESDE